MCGQQTRGLGHCFSWPGHDERHSEHCVRKVFGAERDDIERHAAVRVLLRIHVCEGQSEGLEEDDGVEEEACYELFGLSVLGLTQDIDGGNAAATRFIHE